MKTHKPPHSIINIRTGIAIRILHITNRALIEFSFPKFFYTFLSFIAFTVCISAWRLPFRSVEKLPVAYHFKLHDNMWS